MALTNARLAASALFLAVVLLQIASGAYHSDFASNDDEAPHVVSSLMVRDYIGSGLRANPLRFAEQYYIHYPKVAIGHWPPGFHICEAVWMLAFGRNRAAILSFVLVAEGALILTLFAWLRRCCGLWIAFISALVLATARCMQSSAASATPDILLALFVVWAAVFYARRDLRWAVILGFLALGIHGRAAILFLLPSAAALLGKRFTKFQLALIAPLMLILVFAPSLLGHAYRPELASCVRNAVFFVLESSRAAGWPVMCIAMIGLAAILRLDSAYPEWTTAGALFVAGFVFYTVVNVPLQANYLIATTVATIALFAFGWRSLQISYSEHARLLNGCVSALAVATILFHIVPVERKPDLGARQIVGRLSSIQPPSRVWLVAGTPRFEGAVIAETALLDRSFSQHIVLRSTKVLASSTWSGASYRTRFSGPSAIEAYLDSVHVRWIIAEEGQERPDLRQLASVIETYPLQWRERTTLALLPNFRLFERQGADPSGPLEIDLDMQDKLGRILSLRE